MIKNNDKEWLRKGRSKDIPNNSLSDEEIVDGAHETDQLDQMKSTAKEQENNMQKKAGASPVKHVEKGEQRILLNLY